MKIEASEAIKSEIEVGERLIWAGTPARGLRFRSHDLFIIPFSLMWGGFAVYWEAMALKEGALGFFALWGIPFVLVGLYITVGRFFADAWRRGRVAYGLTDLRILIVSGAVDREVRSIQIGALSDISIVEGRNGTGTLFLGPKPQVYGFPAGSSWRGGRTAMPPSIDLIDDVRQVYAAIRAAQTKSRSSG